MTQTPTKEQALAALRPISLPDGQNLVDSGAVRHLEVVGSRVRVLLVLPDADDDDRAAVRQAAERMIGSLPGVAEVVVDIPGGLPAAAPVTGPVAAAAAEQESGWGRRISGVCRVLAVASGKGGVGKSTVAANLALALKQQDRAVGLLDADIYGPSQQLIMGASDPPEGDGSGRIMPVAAAGGVKVMSIGYLIDANQPVIWRGPMLMKALEQLVGDVVWGELDELVVDLPPGTGDVALTLCQNVPLAGAVIVTTPQDVALIDARKSLQMFRKLQVEVLGIVENMSHFECPSCGHREHIFGAGGGERTAAELGVPFLGAIPLDPAIVLGGDAGTPVVVDRPDSAAAEAFRFLAARIAGAGS